MLVDSHAHVYHNRLLPDQDEVIARARAAGVGKILLPAIDVASIEQSVALCERHPGLFYAMAAIHPSDVKEAGEEDFAAVVRWSEHPSVVAIGETGLDYYWDRSFNEKQHEYLRRHIRLAITRDLPLVFHNREASEDLVRILREEIEASPTPERCRGVFHCFGGPAVLAEEIFSLGFLVGIGGTVTFKNGGVAEVVRDLPLEKILLETDAPFLAPVPFRGKRNEPSYVRYVAEEIGRLKGIPVSEVEKVTTQTAMGFFQIK